MATQPGYKEEIIKAVLVNTLSPEFKAGKYVDVSKLTKTSDGTIQGYAIIGYPKAITATDFMTVADFERNKIPPDKVADFKSTYDYELYLKKRKVQKYFIIGGSVFTVLLIGTIVYFKFIR